MSGVLFRSTRDPQGTPIDFCRALLRGLAPDGGLYAPLEVPRLPPEWPQARPFSRLAGEILQGWTDDPGSHELHRIVDGALDFPVPLVPLSGDRFVLELFHGPTLSFKDVGARTMARLMDRYLSAEGRTATILVATSGDTGSAVADGFAGLERVRVALLYPKGRVSEVQERQLIVARPGVRAFAVEGTFDDCQRMVKEALVDPELAGLGLSSANSINVGRLLPQSTYYVWAVAEARRQGVEAEPIVCVPSGNLGNLTAGVLAWRGGLPVRRFLAAHNANDFFPEYLAGRAPAYAFRETVATLSNAMDVGAPSNFERLDAILGPHASARVAGASVDDDSTRRRMRQSWNEDGYLACPHTAVGLEALERYRRATGDRSPAILLATAHPAKFPETIAEAVEIDAPLHDSLEALRARPVEVQALEPRSEALKQALGVFAGT